MTAPWWFWLATVVATANGIGWWMWSAERRMRALHNSWEERWRRIDAELAARLSEPPTVDAIAPIPTLTEHRVEAEEAKTYRL